MNKHIYSRFDIIEAWYWFCVNFHEGQGSFLYKRLCRIQKYYKPGAFAHQPSTIVAYLIYDDIKARQLAGVRKGQ